MNGHHNASVDKARNLN